MRRHPQHQPAAWQLTALLAVIIFGVIILLISLVAWFGCMGVRSGQISATFLLESPLGITVAVLVISLLLSVVIMLVVQRLLIRPLNQMTWAVRQLAEGHFDTRIQLDDLLHPREVTDFAEHFNIAAERLGSVEILRSDFINNFSHEFRTPIHALVGIAELLKAGGLSPEENEEYLDIIIAQSRRLSELSTSVLSLTKLESTSRVDMAPVNLSELLRQKLLLFDLACSEKALQLEADIAAVQLEGNESLLAQMMGNLLDNAIKFSPQEGVLQVSLHQRDGRAVFRVQDHGCGMDQQTLEHVFDKFYQGDRAHATEGFGLGLPMVKKIVELHQGLLTVESQVGEGSVFTVALPLRQEDASGA